MPDELLTPFVFSGSCKAVGSVNQTQIIRAIEASLRMLGVTDVQLDIKQVPIES